PTQDAVFGRQRAHTDPGDTAIHTRADLPTFPHIDLPDVPGMASTDAPAASVPDAQPPPIPPPVPKAKKQIPSATKPIIAAGGDGDPLNDLPDLGLPAIAAANAKPEVTLVGHAVPDEVLENATKKGSATPYVVMG